MDGENQHPNPVEDYIRKIMSDGSAGKQGKVNIPASGPEIMDKAIKRRKPVFDPTGRIEQISPDEIKIADIRRHPFGLIIIYVQFIIAAALSIGLLVFLLPSVIGSSASVRMFLGLLVLLMTTFGAVFLILATRVYNGNQLIVTDENVTEVQQLGLFNRKVSELTMEDIEDVTANTHGILSTIFNYGILTVETAGEQSNFVFKYCPNPNAYAKALQDTRQKYQRTHIKYRLSADES